MTVEGSVIIIIIIMLSKTLLLALAGVALATEGYVKLDFQKERVVRDHIVKRQTGEIEENITLAIQGSVRLTSVGIPLDLTDS